MLPTVPKIRSYEGFEPELRKIFSKNSTRSSSTLTRRNLNVEAIAKETALIRTNKTFEEALLSALALENPSKDFALLQICRKPNLSREECLGVVDLMSDHRIKDEAYCRILNRKPTNEEDAGIVAKICSEKVREFVQSNFNGSEWTELVTIIYSST